MARGDQKQHVGRGSYGETKREREQRLKRDARDKAKRKQMLNAMSDPERAAFLAGEERAREQARADADARHEAYLVEEVDKIKLMQHEAVRLTGFLHSEIATAIAMREQTGLPEGDWLDDPVAAYQGKAAFGEEVKQAMGVRLLVNLCLDCSNSMEANRIEEPAKAAIRTLYAMLHNVSQQLPEGQLQVEVWSWARGEDGKYCERLTRREQDYNRHLDTQQAVIKAIDTTWMGGEDTWIHPLFAAMLRHEADTGWLGGARLDLVITDGVLEHPTDRREASGYQLQRDGGLTTILLNLLPMAEWADVHLPNHCLQYEATVENLFSLMSKTLGEWIMLI